MPTARTAALVTPFAAALLAADLPRLSDDRLQRTVEFIARRVEVLPSFTRFGVTCIAAVFRVLLAVPGGWPVAKVLVRLPLPLVAEYPRLVRSLGYAFVWETWPELHPDGAER
jgi:hypothetical protein